MNTASTDLGVDKGDKGKDGLEGYSEIQSQTTSLDFPLVGHQPPLAEAMTEDPILASEANVASPNVITGGKAAGLSSASASTPAIAIPSSKDMKKAYTDPDKGISKQASIQAGSISNLVAVDAPNVGTFADFGGREHFDSFSSR